MYNAQSPKDNELPSSQQLLVSTVSAIALALVILAIAVLPAEYGIDPTGIGKSLGLTQMGEIKKQLDNEAKSEPAPTKTIQTEKINETPLTPIVVSVPPVTEAVITEIATEPTPNTDSTQVTLAPGEAAEIKLVMKEGDTVSYQWAVNTGHVNYDVHGDKPGIKYHNYTKGKAVKGDAGELTAAFEGKHGWFWRNRSKEKVTIDLTVTGQFSEVVRVL